MNKNLIVYFCHLLNNDVIKRYNIIKDSINKSDYDIKFISLTELEYNDKFKDVLPYNEFISLGYKLEEVQNYNNNFHINNHLLYNGVFEKFRDYKFYYFIEYDLQFCENTSLNWNNFFNYFGNKKEIDLICTHFNDYHGYYIKRYNLIKLLRYYIKYQVDKIIKSKIHILNFKNIRFSFLPICRLSNELLSKIHEYYQKYSNGNNSIFFEILIPSLANYYNMNIYDLKNSPFYESLKNDEIGNLRECFRINNGSISWYIEDKSKYGKNILVHPVKC